MYRNYLRTAIRNIRKNRLYSFINIIGLTVGLAACLLIGVYIQHELSYDNFHQKGNRIVRLTMEYSSGGTVNSVALTGTKVGPQFKRVFLGIESFARTFKSTSVVKIGDRIFEEKNFLYADSTFFTIFSFPLLEGNAATALDAEDKIVITRNTAKKYFGTESAIDKILLIREKAFRVSGIAENVPQNSQLKFDFVTPFVNLGHPAKEETWWNANYITYLLLREEKQTSALQQELAAYMKKTDVQKEARLDGSDYLKFWLEPLRSVHLYSSLAGFEPKGSIKYIYLFATIAILILIIASANYTNLATAQSAGRAGEIGIRKVLGASKHQVFVQFIGESLVLTLIAALLAFVAGLVLIPFLNQIAGKNFSYQILLQPAVILGTLLLAGVVSFFAGAYPALVLSGTQLMSVLKKGFNFSGSGLALRKSLIVLQFGISVFLIIYTIIIIQQMKYTQVKNLGYDREHILILPVDNAMRNNYENIRKTIGHLPGVLGMTGSYETPEFIEWGDGISATDESGTKNVSVNALPVDLDFVTTMKMQLVAGRDFVESDFALLDTSHNFANYRYSFILNEAAAKKLGWSPQQALGKTIDKGSPGIVTGVVKDFHFENLHEPIKPLVIFLDRDLVRTFLVRMDGNHMASTISSLGETWKERIPHRPFEYHFLDEDYDKLYRSEKQVSTLFVWAAVLAIVLACLGLFGLAAFTTMQRTKEIGIRRVLGAGIGNITWILSSHFLRLVGIAIIIVIPIAWYASHKWLQEFAYRIAINWWVFAFAGIMALLIALATVSFQAIKAALVNPVKSLRNE